ncbi:MAG TPA: hypothetical protein VGN34_03260, partial [Ktedonobacteraceae bacterium]
MNTTATVAETIEAVLRIQADPENMNLSDPSRFYRYEIGQVDLLSSEEVTYLAQRIERGKISKRARGTTRQAPVKESEEAREAKRQLIEANLRLVMHI